MVANHVLCQLSYTPLFSISDLKFQISEWGRMVSEIWDSQIGIVAGWDVDLDAGWSSPVARWAHNPKVAGSNPAPATNLLRSQISDLRSYTLIRGCSSVGRAPRLQRGGQGFESPHLHQDIADFWLPIADLSWGRNLNSAVSSFPESWSFGTWSKEFDTGPKQFGTWSKVVRDLWQSNSDCCPTSRIEYLGSEISDLKSRGRDVR